MEYKLVTFKVFWGFPDSSVGKGSTFNAGNPGLIPGPGRSTGEGIGYPLQSSWASLCGKEFAHNEGDLGSIPRLIRSPGEGKGYSPHSSILAWRIPWTE